MLHLQYWRGLASGGLLSTLACRSCSRFFFFQAEDGIRDLTVTGVQTCALPISTIVVGLADRARVFEGLRHLLPSGNAAQRKMALYCLRDLDLRAAEVDAAIVRCLEIGRASCRERV